MDYKEYKALRAAGQISAGIENSAAMRLVEYLPKRYQYAQFFWSWIWILSIPAGIGLMIFVKWWIGLLVLLASPAVFSATKKSGAQFVLEHAEANEEFFNQLVENEMLIFRESTKTSNPEI